MMTLADLFEAIGNEISVTEWSEVKSSVLFEWKKVIEDHISQPQPVAQGEAVAEVRHFNYSGIARNGLSQEAVLLDSAPAMPDGTKLFATPTIPTGHRVVPVETVGAREAITAAIGFAWGDGELQTVNGDELLRIYALAASPSAGGV